MITGCGSHGKIEKCLSAKCNKGVCTCPSK